MDVRIASKTDTELNVFILPEESPAVLPKVQLSDHVANCEILFHCLKEGDELSQLMCLNTSKGQTVSFFYYFFAEMGWQGRLPPSDGFGLPTLQCSASDI